MIKASEAYLRGLNDLFEALKAKPTQPRDAVPYALFGRLLQVARAILFGVTNGYAGEMKPLARGLVSAAIAIKLISCEELRGQSGPEPMDLQAEGDNRTNLQKESDARALAYLAHVSTIRSRQNKGFLESGWMTEAQFDEVTKKAEADDAASLAFYAEHGIKPSKLGKKTDTWHGLNDHDAADKVGVPDWYDLYYRSFSEESHMSEPAVRTELDRLTDTGKVVSGPQFDDPPVVLRAPVDASSAAAMSLARQLGFERTAQISSLAKPAVEAMSAHLKSLDPAVARRLYT